MKALTLLRGSQGTGLLLLLAAAALVSHARASQPSPTPPTAAAPEPKRPPQPQLPSRPVTAPRPPTVALGTRGPRGPTLLVTKTADTNDGDCSVADCSLREALAAAQSGDTVQVPAGAYTLTLGSQLVIATSLTLTGAGASTTFVQAAANPDVANFRVLAVSTGVTAVVSGVTIRHGGTSGSLGAGSGGGVSNGGNLTLVECAIRDNHITGAVNVGGGLFNSGSLRLVRSVVSGNTAGDSGGGIQSQSGATLVLVNTTVSGNTANTVGGVLSNGAAQLYSSTVAFNTAVNLGAITYVNGSVSLRNSLVAGNLPHDCQAGTSPVVSEGYNLVQNFSSCVFSGDGTGNIFGQDAKLLSLANNGGPTQTQALMQGSPALDAGNPAGCSDTNGALTTDQRGAGFPRSVDSTGGSSPRCDIGAFESGPIGTPTPTPTGQPTATPTQTPVTLVVTKTADTNDGVCSMVDCSLREAFGAAQSGNAVQLPAGTYTLSLGSELTIGTSLSLLGAGAPTTIVQAAASPGIAAFHVFQVNVGTTAVISGVTIRHGGGGNSGGGVSNSGNLTLLDCAIRENHITGVGNVGGGIFTNSTLRVERCAITGNVAEDASGGIHVNAPGSVTLVNSTVSGNAANFTGGMVNNGTLRLYSSSVVGNASSSGGGVAHFGVLLSLRNSLVAGNAPVDCWSGTLTSEGYNLVQNQGFCGLTGDGTGNVIGQLPQLGDLADNGGPTLTHALLFGSPALDAGNPAGCADVAGALSTDQRGPGFPRSVDGDGEGTARCDIGAFESAFLPSPSPTQTATETATEMATSTATLTATPSETPTFTLTPTSSSPPTATATVTPTFTPSPTFTPTETPTRTATGTATSTDSATATTPSASGTPSPSASATATASATPFAPTSTPAASVVPSAFPTPTSQLADPSATPTPVSSATSTVTPGTPLPAGQHRGAGLWLVVVLCALAISRLARGEQARGRASKQ